MWQKFKEQIPVILVIVIIVVGAAFWLKQTTMVELQTQQDAKLTPLREANDALKAQNEETRRTLDATNKMLKDAIAKRESDLFRTDEEVQKLNVERMDALADAIAKKVQPYNPLPKSAEEAEKMQNEQVDKVSSRMTDKISPILAEMAKDQNLTRESITAYSQRISDQVGNVLTAELAKNQVLNNNLQATQAAAQDAMKLSHEITALYLSSFKDQGLITRLLTLPANVVRDAASLSIVSSSDRKKVEQQLMTKMAEIEKKLTEIQTAAPAK
ncbi:MAG: hypothetical protein H7343_15860 [Undibacterium sp.]|nr:hypothetical protein [Opitutaceae bacterium]